MCRALASWLRQSGEGAQRRELGDRPGGGSCAGGRRVDLCRGDVEKNDPQAVCPRRALRQQPPQHSKEGPPRKNWQ